MTNVIRFNREKEVAITEGIFLVLGLLIIPSIGNMVLLTFTMALFAYAVYQVSVKLYGYEITKKYDNKTFFELRFALGSVAYFGVLYPGIFSSKIALVIYAIIIYGFISSSLGKK